MRLSAKWIGMVAAAACAAGGLSACSAVGLRTDGPLDMPIDVGSTVFVQSDHFGQTILVDLIMVANASDSDRIFMDRIAIDRSGGLSVKTAHLIPWRDWVGLNESAERRTNVAAG